MPYYGVILSDEDFFLCVLTCIFEKAPFIQRFNKNMTDYTSQQYCHVAFLLKFFDNMIGT